MRGSLLWNDASDNDGIRPNSATVQLMANGAPTDRYAVLNFASDWFGRGSAPSIQSDLSNPKHASEWEPRLSI